ncbi:MAG: hypothetical protein ACI9XK_002197 [Granulosicoccus sp.]|jgi:hypothetical protein
MVSKLPLSKLRITLIGLVFIAVVAAVASYTHQLIVPLFLGMLTWGKVWLKSLTPKLGALLLKNGLIIQIRQLLVKASTHVFVKSHKPWRRWLIEMKTHFIELIKQGFDRYMALELWLRSVLAILLLLATAGSSFAVFALLVIPQPVLNWLRSQIMGLMNKLGVTQFFSAVWRFILPTALRTKWYMYVKWTLGRQQVSTAKRLHGKLKR